MKQAELYEIRIQGQLDVDWSDSYDGLSLRQEEEDVTILNQYG